MPIYEYVCEKCGAHLEVLQKVGEAPLKRCRKCRGRLEKVVSRTSFQLKGSGWYVTDYSSKAAPSSEKSDATASDSAAVPAGTEKTSAKKESRQRSKA
jgi:putative FmdB family regulatory protein